MEGVVGHARSPRCAVRSQLFAPYNKRALPKKIREPDAIGQKETICRSICRAVGLNRRVEMSYEFACWFVNLLTPEVVKLPAG